MAVRAVSRKNTLDKANTAGNMANRNTARIPVFLPNSFFPIPYMDSKERQGRAG